MSGMVPRLWTGRSEHGGVGIFAGEPIEAGAVVTHYCGPVRFPRLEKDTSRTHSLHILGDMSVVVDLREYRVIDGYWARDATGSSAELTPVPASLAPFLGSMMNSSRGTKRDDNVTTKPLEHDDGDPIFQCEELTRSAVCAHFSEAQTHDSLLSDKGRKWMKLAFVSKRCISEGEELLWSYQVRES